MKIEQTEWRRVREICWRTHIGFYAPITALWYTLRRGGNYWRHLRALDRIANWK